MQSEVSNYNLVVVTSDEPWGDIWHTQLHYAFQLSKRFKVIFLGPPSPWKISNLFNFKLQSNAVSENLLVITYKNFLPSFMGRLAIIINDFVNEQLLKSKIRDFTSDARLIIWHFDPYRSHFIFRKNSDTRHVYHVIDPIAGYHMDEEMAGKADIVVVTSPKFLDHYKALNKKVIQVGQGIDLEFFKKTYSPDELKAQVSFDSILLLGTFSDEIDYRFLKLIATRYPGKLVLIGPDKTTGSDAKKALNEVRSSPGVTWLGPMNPSSFHIHISACRVGIISYCYENYERNNLRSPLKVISYLACGKCIISNIDCEIPSLTGKAVYNVNNDDAYFELLDASYENKLTFDHDAVNKYLSAIDYQKLLSSIFELLEEELPPLK